MNRIFKIIIIIILFAILTSPLFLKLKNIDEKFALTQISFEYPSSFQQIKDLFTNYFYTKVKLTISNYSDIPITVKQVKVHLYTLKNNLFLEQFQPLAQPVKIEPNTQTIIEVPYQIYYTNLIKLIEDNELKGTAIDTFRNLVKYGSLNTEIIAKGFAIVQGITIKVNEQFKI